jgi:hypothetical protein
VLFAIPCKTPGACEKKLKNILRNRGFLRTGNYPDGRRGTEFIVFHPDEAPEIREIFEIACEGDETVDPALLMEQEKTKQATAQSESDARKAEADSTARKAEADSTARKAEAEAQVNIRRIEFEMMKYRHENGITER